MWNYLPDNNKPNRNKDGQDWVGLTRITNNELEKFTLNISRRAIRDAGSVQF